MKRNSILLLMAFLILAACDSQRKAIIVSEPQVMERDVAPSPSKKAKNIILLIGDGMGITQITSGLYSNGNRLQLERIKKIGLHKNYASDALITDSAAGATAFACGKKTYNGAIAVDPDSNAMVTILEEAEMKGLKTGLVATSTIVHATPASFIAHNKSRKNYEEIALDFLNVNAEILIGGGQESFERRDMDERNLSDEFRAKGYVVSGYSEKEINEVILKPDDKLMYYTADKQPLPFAQGRDYLKDATELAINHLDTNNEDGFFLMVESSQIDWGGHSNEGDYVISEMLEFDEVIGKVLDFVEADGNTLLIITADHETGGLALQKESKLDSLVTAFTSDYHTAELIPVFAYGPGSEEFMGIYENTDIYHKMRAAFGWE